MSRNYKITLEYEGTRYNGWQKQKNTQDTIQGKLERILERMTGIPTEVHGSGRTDAGVHAYGQVANFHLPDDYSMPEGWEKAVGLSRKKVISEEENIQRYLNHYLPEDIRVIQTEKVEERFHSRLSAVKKVYIYEIETGEKQDVFRRRIQYHLGKELDLDAMKKGAGLLLGTHDFKSFCGNKKMKKSTVRTLYSIDIFQEQDSSLVRLIFTGNGFLQNMVRILTGTLIEIGLGERQWQSVTDVLEAKDRQLAGFTAPAEGLSLSQVIYEEMK